jgi:hypothetical protein
MTQIPTSSRMSNLFQLDYPQSVGVYDTYEDAQKAVDFLADSKFPVENLCIVGTELRSVERVLGRRTWATVFGAGLQNGVTTGVLVAMLMWFVQPAENILVLLAYALSMGLLIGVVISVVSHLVGRGRRDFTSVSQTVATKYEILAEHKVAGMARELVATMPGAKAAMFAPPARPVQQGYTSYGQGYAPGYPPAAPTGYPPASAVPPSAPEVPAALPADPEAPAVPHPDQSI